MTTEEAKAYLEHAVENVAQASNQSDVQTYWNAFKDFCSQPVDNDGQSIILSCTTAVFQ